MGRSTGDDIVAFPYIPHLSLIVDAIQLDRQLADPDVVSLEEDVPLQLMDNQSNALIHAPDIWKMYGDTGQGCVIVILDSGVAACAPGPAGCPIVEHPALQGRVVSEPCYSTTSAKLGVASFCPGGTSASTLYYSGVNCLSDDPELLPRHGRHLGRRGRRRWRPYGRRARRQDHQRQNRDRRRHEQCVRQEVNPLREFLPDRPYGRADARL
jgi:hypothetical protein